MLIFNAAKNKYVIDPHFLTIIPLKNVHATECGEEKLLWMYHRYNPHSPFRDYADKKKSQAIVESTFPKEFLDKFQKSLQDKIDEANLKNKDLDAISNTTVTPEGDIKPTKKENVFVPTLRIYDPEEEEEMKPCIEWYREHLQQTPLWFAFESYKEAIYNLSSIIRNPNKSSSDIKTASTELDSLPLKMEKMRQQAIKDEANTLKITGDKIIKRGERVDTVRAKQNRDNAPKFDM